MNNREKLNETLKSLTDENSAMADSKTKTDFGHAVGKINNSDETNVDQFGLTDADKQAFAELLEVSKNLFATASMMQEFKACEQAFSQGVLPFDMLRQHNENMKILPTVEKYFRYLQSEYAQRRNTFISKSK